MNDIRKTFEKSEIERRHTFENFAQRNKDNEFMTNILILKMRGYHYKELLKVYALNYKSEEFAASKNSMYCFLFAPAIIALGFNIISPFSIFKRILVVSAFGGSVASFLFSFKEELAYIAKKDQTILG